MSKTKIDSDDWLMVEYYRKIGSKYGCKMCEKTHFTKDCKYLKDRQEPNQSQEKLSYSKMYSIYDYDEGEHYGY